MDTQTQKVMFSSKSDEWETPQSFFNKLNKTYKFTLDPCSTSQSAKCEKYYTLENQSFRQDHPKTFRLKYQGTSDVILRKSYSRPSHVPPTRFI